MELTGVKISLRRKGARTAGALHSTGGGQGVSASMAGEISTLTQRLDGLRSLLIPVASDGAELDYSQASLAVRLKSRLDLYSEGNMSALGATTEAGTGGTGGTGGGSLFGLMRDWPSADPGKSTEDALGANLGWELRQGLADARTLLDTHVADSVRHVTGSERTRWNKAATDLSAIMGSDGDNVLNKWEEIVAFLATYTEADTLANLLSNKADKSQLSGYVTLDTEQKITGQKIFGTHMLIDCPWDTHDRYLFFREGGTSTYGGYVKYCGDDYLRIGTRNGDETVDVEAIAIKRGSTKVWLKGDVDIAGYTTVGNGLSVTGTVTADTIKRRGGTSLQLLTADGGIRTLHTLGAVGTLGWSGTSGQVVSVNTLAYWDGRFAGGSGNSNLLYCAKGKFGDIVTRNTADFTVWAHGHKITKGTQYILLGVCPPTSDSTYDSLHITGDFGGLNSNGRCAVDVYVGRRNGTYFRGFVNHESPENWDIGINDAGEVYLIFYYQWCAYNLNLFALQAEIKWDGKVSTPTDTNFVLLSESDSVAHFNDIRFKGISNVAVRLERVSRLWGRPFDGTGDVTGSLTSVADITMSGKLTIGGCEITWDAAQGALRFSTSAYSEGEMAGKGATSDSGSSSGGSTGGGSYDRLDSWAAYSADKAGYVLSALLGYDLHTRLTQAASDISSLRSSVSANAGSITSLGNTLRGEITTLGNTLRSEAASKYVTLSTGQTITGIKRFAPECLRVEGEHSQNYISILHSVNTGIPTADRDYRWTIYHAADGSNFRGLAIWSYDGDGKRFNPVARFESVPENALRVFGKITAHGFVREGGTSAMFLKGDGSVDTTPYLPRSVFDELFVKELQADGSYAIRAKFSLYSDGEVASKGAASGQGTGGSGVSYDRLDSWNDYDSSAGAVLSATLGYGLLTDINALRADVTALKGAGFLTEHQDISHLLKIDGSNGTVAGVQALIGKLPVWGSAPTDTALFIAQSTSYPNQWGLRTTSSLWNWLKPKTDAVYQPKGDYQTPNGYVASLYSANALPLKSNSLQYYSGQPTKDLCFEGSSTDLSLWSYPGPGITSVGENSVNIQSLRMWFGSMWLNEIFCSPNANGLWYRHAVNNSTATTAWEKILTDANFHTVTGKDYVRIIGDKMTGRLTAPSIGINGAGSSAYLTADAAYNAYININGVNLMVWEQNDMSIRAGLSQHDKVTLGTSNVRWKNVYATTINVSSTELVSKLNADMVDGHHEGDFLINRGGNYQGLLYDIPCKSFYSAQNNEDSPVTGTGWISGIVLGANFNSDHYQAHLVHHNNNDHWYSSSRHKDGKMTSWNEFAFVTSNVASATKLQTTRSIWGQSFNGAADVKGSLFLSDHCYIAADNAGTGFSINRHESKTWKQILFAIDGDGNAFLNKQLTVWGATELKSAVTVNGQLTATGNAIVRGTLDVNGILTATNKVRLYDELFFEPAGNAGPYLSPAGGKLSIAFHDNYTWVKTPIVLDKDGLLTLDGQLKIGGITMSYDASQGALRIEGNAYTTGGFAALGIPTLGAQYSETFVGRLCAGGEADEPVGAVIDFNDLSSLESFSGWNADGEADVLFNLGYLGINEGVAREINGKHYADYGKIALAVTPLMVEKINQIDTSRTNMQKDIDDLKRRVYALEH